MKRLALFAAIIVFTAFFSMPSHAEDIFADAGVRKIGPSPAPAFTLKDLSGKKTSLKDFSGSVVVLNFWATWCPPCVSEMPSLEALHKKLGKKGVSVVAVNDYEAREKPLRFIKKYGYSFKVLVDEEGKTSEAYKATVLPTTFIIDKNGMAVGSVVGGAEWDSPAMIKLLEAIAKK